MNYPDDTITAISTPVGQGGIGIVRLSGDKAFSIADRIFISKNKTRPSEALSHSMLYGHVIDPINKISIDEVLASVMRAPNSYTREDIIEINCHGGMVSVRRILEIVIQEGARLAEPGEFTKRAFLNNRISLSQAEAVLDLINAKTEESLKIALEQLEGGLSAKLSGIRNVLIEICASVEAYIDFPEDEIDTQTIGQTTKSLAEIKKEIENLSKTFDEARFFREGLSVAIVGRPNVGKSSLLNALLKKDRAIVTEIPGTTRDLIEDYININGLPIRIIDTAGIRNSDEIVEKEGIRRSLKAIENADLIIAMLDGSETLKAEDFGFLNIVRNKNTLIVINKTDLDVKISSESVQEYGKQSLYISAVTGKGLEELKSGIFNSSLKEWKEEREGLVVSNIRHKLALDKAAFSISNALNVLKDKQPLEIFSIEIRNALDKIGEITGAITTEEILNKIFSDFCIGK